jgi:hypothetical protein
MSVLYEDPIVPGLYRWRRSGMPVLTARSFFRDYNSSFHWGAEGFPTVYRIPLAPSFPFVADVPVDAGELQALKRQLAGLQWHIWKGYRGW